jgi:hypothetical protein
MQPCSSCKNTRLRIRASQPVTGRWFSPGTPVSRYDNVTLSLLVCLTGAQADWGLRCRIYPIGLILLLYV